MEEITRFVLLAQTGRFTATELCEQFGISRKTGYKHLERYAAQGLKGLQPRSHRPHGSIRRRHVLTFDKTASMASRLSRFKA